MGSRIEGKQGASKEFQARHPALKVQKYSSVSLVGGG
jgi:hypothetical protein